MRVHLTPKSSNSKTGPIPVSTTSSDTCPSACPFKSNGCYADSGPLKIHWSAVTAGKRGDSWSDFLEKVRLLPAGTLWRHNQAGDLPGDGDKFDHAAFLELASANIDKRGFTYTHKPLNPEGVKTLKRGIDLGFTTNLSANTLKHADRLMKTGLPVVVTLPSGDVAKRSQLTPAGYKVVTCPATRSNTINCKTCALCQKADRGFIIGFPAHGTGRKKVDKITSNKTPALT